MLIKLTTLWNSHISVLLTSFSPWGFPFHSSIAPQPFVGSWTLLQFHTFFMQTVGLLAQDISPSQGRYLHTGQHKHRINAHNTDIHALSGIRTHDPSVPATEDISCLRPRGYRDRQPTRLIQIKFQWATSTNSRHRYTPEYCNTVFNLAILTTFQ
jgi:hypothetical protein